ncbi:hypothetical protein EGJ07_17635 [Stutzerimonas stutzeri]|nr:hypothetical protein EGJ07_17635 [Stutzerimonas stutzeri]
MLFAPTLADKAILPTAWGGRYFFNRIGRKQFFRYAAPASFQSEPLLYRLNQLRPLVANIANSLAYLEPLEIVRRSSLTQQ